MTLQISTLTEFENACIDVLNANITHIAIGTGTSTPIISQTTLDTETYREAIFESSSISNTFTTSLFLDVTEAIGDTITEIGAFNSNSGGTMISRNLTTPKLKTNSLEFFYDIKYTIEASNN